MLVPLSWLKEYVSWDLSPTELAETLTLAGLEVAAVERIGEWWDADTVTVGRVAGVHAHPQADRLVLVDVEYGADESERVVTGAPNLFAYRDAADLPALKVAFARAGAILVDAYSDKRPRPRKRLKASKIRGVRSSGMVCSELELGLSEEHEGIMLLPEDAPVGAPLGEYLRDDILELDLTPDMARALSLMGVAREVAALTGGGSLQLELPHLPAVDAGAGAHPLVDLAIDEPELCSRYVASVVADVQVGPSPAWMQQRLTRAGMRPINNIVDITNYVMLETGQPLHAFDYDRLSQRAAAQGRDKPLIRMRQARPGEKILTLDGTERDLVAHMLLITDTEGPIAIAGVMGGAETEVSADTRTILLESAAFDGISNRRTAQALRLHSEASHRFTRGVPAELNPRAAARAVQLFVELAGGHRVAPLADLYPLPQPQPIIHLTASEVNRQLGLELELKQVRAALHSLDIRTEIAASGEHSGNRYALQQLADEPLLSCQPPWHRLDLSIPADLTEEVARVIGYERVGYTYMAEEIPRHVPSVTLAAEERIRDVLSGIGLQEAIGHSYSSAENHARLTRHALGDQAPDFVTVTNPYHPDKSVMRRDLLVSALENLAFNLRHEPRLQVFELGVEFHPDPELAPFPREERTLQLALTGPRQPSHYARPASEEMLDYYDLKGVLETLCDRLGLKDVQYEAAQDIRYGPYCARLTREGQEIGLAGELHPAVRAAYQLPAQPVAIARLDIASLVTTAWKVEPMTPISPYPAVLEDLAFLVDTDTPAMQVEAAIHRGGGAELMRVELFDLYQGPPLPEGRKSLAYTVTYQALDRNLEAKDTERIRRRIEKAVSRDAGGTLRSS